MRSAKQQYHIVRRSSHAAKLAHTLKKLGLGLFLVLASFSVLNVYTYTRGGGDARVHAAVPAELNFQARLLQSNGAIVPDGTYSVSFNLYTAASGGSPAWNEVHATVPVKSGYLSVYLGSVDNDLNTLDWSQQYWLTMNVNADGEMDPRLKLTSVPYSFRSGQADTITNGAGTLSASDLVQLAPSSVQAVNTALAALRINQNGAGLLAQFQGNGSDVFTVSKTGDVNASGSLDVGAALTAGSGNAFQVNTSGDITAVSSVLNGSSTANGGSGLGTSTSLVLTSAANFDVGNYVQVNSANCGGTGINPCYAKITAKATNTLTITPALRWTTGATVTEYHIPEIGGTDLTQDLANRYGRGYFIAGVATGNGTTVYNEDEISSSLSTFNLLSTNVTTLNIGAGATTINLGSASTNLQLSGLSLSNAAIDIGDIDSAGGLDIFDGTGQKAVISTANLTTDRTFTLPDASGTFCLTATCFALGGNASTGTATLGTTTAQQLVFITNNVQAINIDTAGNVRLGNGSATEKLDVNGGIRVGNSTGTNSGTIRWNGSDFEGYNGTEWKSFTQGGGGGAGVNFVSGLANVAASVTGAPVEMLLFTSATAVSNTVGVTGFTAPAAGSFRTCLVKNNAAITGGTLRLRWRVNGVSVGANACTMSNAAATSRQSATMIESGVTTFNAGDTIGIAFDTTGLAPTTNDFTVFWSVEYNSAIGGGGGGASSLQEAYDGSGAPAIINTSDAKNINFNLSNTTTDSNFLVDILTGSTGRFAVQDNGTDAFAVSSSAITLSKAVTASAGINLSNSGITNAGSITGVGTNITAAAALTVASGSGANLTLTSASGIAVLGASTLQTASNLTLDINNASNTTLALQNNGAGTATLNLADGALQTAGTTRLTNGGALQNITGLTISSGGASITGNIALGGSSSDRLTITSQILGGSPLVFQGATDNGFATTFALADPTANNTITIPNASGALVLDSRSILAGTGLTGGGNLSADRTLSLDINGLTTTTAINNSDTLAIYEGSGIKKISRSDFLQGLTGALQYQGTWDAATNTPSISDGTGQAGHTYAVSVAGTQNLGSGNINFALGDFVIHNGTVWQRAPSGSTITSVFGRTGAITGQNGDYTASQITNVAAGGLSSITVQAALNELDTEKLSSLNGLSMTSQTFANDTNVTITSAGSTHTLGWTGLLGVGRGGTGAGSFTTNGIIFGNNTGALNATAAGTGGQLLLANASGIPGFASVSGDATLSDMGVLTIGANAVTLGTDTAGDYISSLGTLTGLSVTGNSGEGSTPALSVLYGSTANTAVQGNTAITVTAGTNLSGGGNITLGSGGTVTLDIVNNPSFSTSVTTPLLTNAGDLTISSTGVGSDLTLSADGQIMLSGFNCSTFDNGGVLTVTAGGVLTCDNDDGGGGGGSLSGSGASGRVAVYSGTTSLTNSWLLQDTATLRLDTGKDFDIVGGGLQLAGTTVLTSSGALQNITDITASGTAKFTSLSAGGLVKADTAGALDIAVAGTDYEVPLTFNNGLTRNTNTVSLGGSLTASTDIALGTNNLTFSGTGALAIGTNTPINPSIYKLEVRGALAAYSTDYNLMGASTSLNAYGYFRSVDTSDAVSRFELGAYDINGASQGGRDLVLNPLGGNVGIGGDLTPDALFSVGGTSQFQVSGTGAVVSVGINNSNGGISSTGAIAGATTISASGAITAATATNTINGLVINTGTLSAVTGITFTSGALNLNSGGITNTGSIAGATTINASGAITAATTVNTINGLIINSGALSGISTINASGAITAATATNTINGLVINSGALSGVTGITFTSGSLNLNNGGITNTGSITGATSINASGAITAATATNTINGLVVNSGALSSVTGITFTSGNLALGGGNISGVGTLSLSGAITGATATNTINGLIINSGALSGISTINASGAITAATATNTINGLVINSGALSSVTGITFTSGVLNLNSGGITNTGSIAGATTINASGLATLGAGANITGDLSVTNGKILVQHATAGASIILDKTSVGAKIGSLKAGDAKVAFFFDDTGSFSISKDTRANISAGTGAGTDLLSIASSGAITVTSSISGLTTLGLSGAITGATTTNTINGLIINSGSLSGITGFSQTSGNFEISGTGTFITGTGAVSLNGATTVTGTNTLTVSGGLTTLSAGLTVTGAVNFNVSANNAVNINTGTSTGAITLGGGNGAFTVASTGIDISTNSISDANSLTSVNNTNLTLNALGTGNLVFTGYNCTGNTSNGTLTANASGVVSCDDDNTGISDARLKENVLDLNDSILDRMKDVRTVNFDFDCSQEFFATSLKDCLTGRQTGVIAQELAQLFPELVTMEEDGYYRVNYAALNIYTLKSTTELARTVDSNQNVSARTLSTNNTVRLNEQGMLQNINGLSMVSGGASVVGGIDNNGGGMTEAGAIMGATTIEAEKLTLNATGNENMLELKKDGAGVFTVYNSGALELRLDSTQSFTVKDASGMSVFTIDTLNGNIRIGSGSDAKTVLFTLDSKDDESAEDPIGGVNGSSYYNTRLQRFRCYQDNKWTNCLPVGNLTDPIALGKTIWTGMPYADTEFPGEPRILPDLEKTHEFKLRLRLTTAAAANATCRLQFAETDNGPWTDMSEGGTGELKIDRSGTFASEWFKIKEEARKEEIVLRVMCKGGNGIASPVFYGVSVQFR